MQVLQVEAGVDEALDSAGWADAAALAPAALAPGDAAALLERCPAVRRLAGKAGGGGAVLAGTCAVTPACLADLQARADDAARAAAREALAERRSAAAPAAVPQGGNPNPSPSPSVPSPGTGHKGRKAAAAAPDPYALGPDSDDDGGGGGGRGGKGKKPGGKGGKARRAAGKAGRGGAGGDAGAPPGGAAAAPRKAQNADAAVAARLLSADALAERVAQWLPEAEGAGEGGALCGALAAHVRPGALRAYEAALAAVFSAGADARR